MVGVRRRPRRQNSHQQPPSLDVRSAQTSVNACTRGIGIVHRGCRRLRAKPIVGAPVLFPLIRRVRLACSTANRSARSDRGVVRGAPAQQRESVGRQVHLLRTLNSSLLRAERCGRDQFGWPGRERVIIARAGILDRRLGVERPEPDLLRPGRPARVPSDRTITLPGAMRPDGRCPAHHRYGRPERAAGRRRGSLGLGAHAPKCRG